MLNTRELNACDERIAAMPDELTRSARLTVCDRVPREEVPMMFDALGLWPR